MRNINKDTIMKKLIGLLLAILVAVPVWAAETPETQIKQISDEVLEIISNDDELQHKGNTGPAIALIDAKVLQPHFNFRHMTKLGMGKEWRKATPEQQDMLVKEFKTLLVRTYSNALTTYKNPTVRLKPTRNKPTDTEAQVRTKVLQPGIKPVDIDYSLEKLGDEWKVFDVVVAGVSLVTNYRQFFGQEIRNGGVDGLIKSLQAKNREPEKR